MPKREFPFINIKIDMMSIVTIKAFPLFLKLANYT